MSESVQMWLFGAAFGGLITIYVWIYYHSIRDAKRESRLAKLGQEIGHPTIHGSILERLHRYAGHIRSIRAHLRMDEDEQP